MNLTPGSDVLFGEGFVYWGCFQRGALKPWWVESAKSRGSCFACRIRSIFAPWYQPRMAIFCSNVCACLPRGGCRGGGRMASKAGEESSLTDEEKHSKWISPMYD